MAQGAKVTDLRPLASYSLFNISNILTEASVVDDCQDFTSSQLYL
jgi:hypothetical protein